MAPAAIIVAMLAFGAAMFLVTPLIARRDLFFGVTVPPSFHDEADGRRIMRRYRVEVVLHAVIAAVLASRSRARTARCCRTRCPRAPSGFAKPS